MSLRIEERSQMIRLLQKSLSQLDGVRGLLEERGEFSALKEVKLAIEHTLACQQAVREPISSA